MERLSRCVSMLFDVVLRFEKRYRRGGSRIPLRSLLVERATCRLGKSSRIRTISWTRWDSCVENWKNTYFPLSCDRFFSSRSHFSSVSSLVNNTWCKYSILSYLLNISFLVEKVRYFYQQDFQERFLRSSRRFDDYRNFNTGNIVKNNAQMNRILKLS